MRKLIGNLWLGPALILTASAGLLLSDLSHRTTATTTSDVPRIAFFYFANRPVVIDCLDGVYEGLANEGLIKDKDYTAHVFDAQTDMTTANTIAKAISGGEFDMVITLTTPALQTMAGANQQSRLTHVFGCVTDPAGSGVGINPNDPGDHPPYLAGVGTFQPVERSIELAREMLPGLKTVGVVWTSSEACAEACVVKARAKCEELGITLHEAQVDNANGVLEAAKSLVTKGIDAFWVGGDNTVELAISTLAGVATSAGVPVFTNSPSEVEDGALFGLGADYFDVGVAVGEMAGRIRKGADPAAVRIENVVPESLGINLAAMKGLKAPWQISEKLRASASILIDENGRKKAAAPKATTSSRPGGRWKLSVVHYTDDPVSENTVHGLLDQFANRGLVKDRDYSATVQSAHGETATLMSIIDEALTNKPDMFIALSTPVLQAAVEKVTALPIIFSMVADPMAAGAGKSYEQHSPHITGITTFSDFEGTARLVRECFPQARTVGTLFTPSEVNSVIFKDALQKAVEAEGLTLQSVAAMATSDVPEAAVALLDKDVDVICQISDNLANSAYSIIAKTATRRGAPLVAFGTSFVAEQGAVIGLCRDYEQAGRDAADMAIRVMNGESPGHIPFAPVSKTVLIVNPKNAAAIGWTVPPAVLARADKVVGD